MTLCLYLPYHTDAKTGAMREHDKSSETSAEMKFMRMTKYAWQDYKTKTVTSEIKTNPVFKKIQN